MREWKLFRWKEWTPLALALTVSTVCALFLALFILWVIDVDRARRYGLRRHVQETRCWGTVELTGSAFKTTIGKKNVHFMAMFDCEDSPVEVNDAVE